jgi:glycosyltransferase involved in cell wall biosynthesis
MAKRFDEVHVISKEARIGVSDRTVVRDERAPNLIFHKVRAGPVSSNLDVLRIARSVKLDAVFGDAIVHSASSLLCKKRCKIPIITFIQGYEADLKAIRLKLKLQMKPNPGLLSNVFSVYDMLVLRASSRILCVSLGLANYARKSIPRENWDRIGYVPHSLEYVKPLSDRAETWAHNVLNLTGDGKKRKTQLLMAVGIESSKGTDVALKTHRLIVDRKPNALLALVGKEIDSRYLRMVEDLGLEGNVLVLSNLPRDHVLALLSHARIFLAPSFSEGFGFSVAEAMASRVPIVAYVNKSLRDAARRGAIAAVQTTDPKDYAEKCLSLLDNEELALQLIQKAEGYVKPLLAIPEEERLSKICDLVHRTIIAS